MRIINLRFRVAAPPEGCRWCGVRRYDHGSRWVPGHGWHPYVDPTPAQVIARMQALRSVNRAFAMPGNATLYESPTEAANRARTRL